MKYVVRMVAFWDADLSRMDLADGRPVCCENNTKTIIKEY